MNGVAVNFVVVRRMLLIFLILFIAGYWLLRVYKQNRLNQLVSSVSVVDYADDFAEEGFVFHYTTRKFKRITTELSEPSDPYHRPVLPFYTSCRIVETWVSADGLHEIERLDDANRTVIGERFQTSDEFAAYDTISNMAFRFTRANEDSDADSGNSVSGTISRINQSTWGTEGLRIRFDPQQIDMSAYDNQTVRLAEWGPYASDLQFDHTQSIWVVDSDTNLMISEKTVAITDSGEVTLRSTIRTKPELVHMDTLAFEWGDFITDEARASDRLMETMPESAEEAAARAQQSGKIDDGRARPIEVAATAGHDIYILDSYGLDGSDLDFQAIFAPRQMQCFQDNMAYSIATCQDGLVIVEYVSTDSSQGMIVSIGLSKDVVPRLKRALPAWSSSESKTLHIAGSESETWLLFYPAGQDRHSVIFERDGLFIQIDGYGMSINELLEHLPYLKAVSYE